MLVVVAVLAPVVVVVVVAAAAEKIRVFSSDLQDLNEISLGDVSL